MAAPDSAFLLAALLLLCHTWRAWAVVEVNMEEKVEVERGQPVQISCMYTSDDGAGGMTIEWLIVGRAGEKERIYSQDSFQSQVDKGTAYTDRINVTSTGASGVTLTIDEVQLNDEREFICLVKSLTDGDGDGSTNLKVFEKPDYPTIEGTTTAISADQDQLSKIGSCQVTNGYPKPNITWYKNNVPLRNIENELKVESVTTTQSSGLLSVQSSLSMKVKKEDKDAEFYCAVTYFIPGASSMTETDRINLTVIYPSTEVYLTVASPKRKIKEGDTVKLQCIGNGNSPSSYSFKHEEDELSSEGNELVLENVRRLQSGKYKCTSMDMETFEEITNATDVFVNYLDPPAIEPEDTVIMSQELEMKATCNALSSLQTHTTWIKDGEEVSKGHTLTVMAETYKAAGKYMCVVSVPEIEGMETTREMQVFVRGPPQIKEDDVTEVEASEETVVLSCSAQGYPTPKITWIPPEEQVDMKVVTELTTNDSSQVKISVKVESDVTLKCEAKNEEGEDKAIFKVKAVPTVYTTTQATTTTTTQTTVTTAGNRNVTKGTPNTAEKVKTESNGVIIAVIIICILLLAILGSVLYFLYKRGKICGRSGKQDLTKEKSGKDNIVVEMKSDNTEEAILLGANGEKQPPNDQYGGYLHMQK